MKEVKAPFVFDGEHGIALHTMQGNWALSRGKGEVPWFFSSCGRNLGFIPELRLRWPFSTRDCEELQDSCLVVSDNSGFSSRLFRAIGMPIDVRREAQCPFPVPTGLLGFLSIYKRSQASSPFEALNSSSRSSCQKDVRPPVEIKQGSRAFSTVSTVDSVIPSSCEMIDEPAFKSLLGYTAIFRVRESRCPLHLTQQTPGHLQIPIAERSLLLS